MLKMSSTSLHVLFQPLSETWGSFVNWTCEKQSNIFSSVTFTPETVVGFERQQQWVSEMKVAQKKPCIAPISRGFKSGKNYTITAPTESFADSLHTGIVQRHVQRAQSPMHLAESALLSDGRRLQSSINVGSRN